MTALSGRRPAVLRTQTGSVYKLVLLFLVLCLLIAGVVMYFSYLKQWLVTSADSQTTSTAQQSHSSSTTGYLVVKEWGIKLPAQGILEDASYSVEGTTAKLSTSSIVDVNPDCGNQYTLIRSSIKPTTNTNGVIMENGQYSGTYLTKVGSYYYIGIEAQASCTDSKYTPTAAAQQHQQQLQLEVRDAYMDAARQLSAL